MTTTTRGLVRGGLACAMNFLPVASTRWGIHGGGSISQGHNEWGPWTDPALRTVTGMASARHRAALEAVIGPAIWAIESSQLNPRMTLATAFRSATKSFISSSRETSSGARNIDDGWTVAITWGASGDGISFPRCWVTLKDVAMSA